jgi:hypothetical protein
VKIVLPGQDIDLQTSHGIEPQWYEKLKQIEAVLNGGTVGQGTLATTATTGFGFMPTCAGTPTGIPVAKAGYVPFVYDITANKLWVYNGAWKGVVLT